MASRKAHNALTFGLYARETVLPWEDATKFDAFVQAIRNELNPNGPLEEEVASEVAEMHWRSSAWAWAIRCSITNPHRRPSSSKRPIAGWSVCGSSAEAACRSGATSAWPHAGGRFVKAQIGVGRWWRTRSPLRNRRRRHAAHTGTARGVVECAYDPVGLDQLLKVEMKIDSRIGKIMARLVGLKEYKRLYCRELVPALPSAMTPPLVVECSDVQSAPETANATSQPDETKEPKVRKWGDLE